MFYDSKRYSMDRAALYPIDERLGNPQAFPRCRSPELENFFEVVTVAELVGIAVAAGDKLTGRDKSSARSGPTAHKSVGLKPSLREPSLTFRDRGYTATDGED